MKNFIEFYPIKPMKRAIAGIFLISIFLSCVKETLIVEPEGNVSPVLFSVKVPVIQNPTSTRVLTEAHEKDVQNIDVLLFNSSETLELRVPGTGISVENSGVRTFQLAIPEGNYAKMVVLANASELIDALPVTATTYTEVQENLILSLPDKWNATPNSPGYKPIPMWGELTNVQITGSTTQFSDLIDLYRMLARVNVRVTADNFKLSEVILYHPADEGLLIPSPSAWNEFQGQAIQASWLSGFTRTSATWSYDNVNTSDNELVNEIYIPEVLAGELADNTKNTFLVLKGKYGTDPEDTYYRIDIADYEDGTPELLEEDDTREMIYFPVLRNFTYEITVTDALCSGEATAEDAANKPPANLRTKKLFRNDFEYDYYVYDNHYFLAVESREFSYDAEAGTFDLKVYTDYPGGWTAKCSTSPTNPDAGNPQYSWLTVATATGPQYGTTVNYSVTFNTTTSPRIAYIHFMTDGGLHAVVEVFQHIKAVHKARLAYFYVGAFWRSDQTGERLIRMLRRNGSQSINGDWRADVVIGEDWIKLDTIMSADLNIQWRSDYAGGTPADMNDPAMDAIHQVSGTSTIVKSKGTADDIYFRIGLRSTIEPTENRYGLIIFSYNNYTESSLIFVRQGEQGDYLMRPEDNNFDGNITTEWGGTAAEPRPNAVKYSPYNLTADEFNSGSSEESILVGPRGGTWTSYPSMAGGLFQFAPFVQDNIGRAWNPVGTVTLLGKGNAKGFWSDLSATNETCPPTWRRPNDGSITGEERTLGIADSEMRQSLYWDPFTGRETSHYFVNINDNMIYGYYADGYFDRHTISQNMYVNEESSRVAYWGLLYYNPNTYASLFFPSTGYRNGTFYQRGGGIGYYWSSTVYSDDYAMVSISYNTFVGQPYMAREVTLPIRCVKEF